MVSDPVFEEKIVGNSKIKVFVGRPTSVYQMFSDTVNKYPNREALKFEDVSLTYSALSKRVDAVASYLMKECGISKGDRIALLIPNDDHFVSAYLATSKVGAISVVLNTMLKRAELQYQIELTTPSCVIVDENLWATEWDSMTKAVIIRKGSLNKIYDSGMITSPVSCDEEDVHTILFTSGTTGKPKGVQILNRNLICSALRKEKYSELMGVDPPEGEGCRMAIVAPLFHVMALQEQLLPSIKMGGAAVLMKKFKALPFLELLEKEKIDRMTGSPAMLRLLLINKDYEKFNLSGLRLVGFGGAPMPPELIKELKRAFCNAKLSNGFGLTEASVCCSNFGENIEKYGASIGKATLGCEVKIVDKDRNDVPVNTVGEIVVKGAHVTGGYCKDPESTAKSFKDGEFFTGDLGHVDDKGFFYVSSRKTDMVNRGGENVYPVEVENTICLHPKVLEVAVFGVKDNVMGEKVACAIVPIPGKSITLEEIQEFCSDKLARYKIPEYVVCTDALPRNPGGKVVKKQLRSDLEQTLTVS